MLTCEIFITDDTSMRGREMLQALAKNAPAGIRISVTDRYRGESQWLMLYGAGGVNRIGPYREHQSAGRHVICWDLGYWNRDCCLRFSIDAMHPQEMLWSIPDLPAARFDALGITLSSSQNNHGPIIFAAMGRKSKAIHGTWDKVAIADLRRRFPGREIIVREKPSKAVNRNAPRIQDVLPGSALVVTRHSNVAIDAIIAGIPFECADGAAMAYRGDRLAFLRQLAWFQWQQSEAVQAWKFILQLLEK